MVNKTRTKGIFIEVSPERFEFLSRAKKAHNVTWEGLLILGAKSKGRGEWEN